MTKIKDITDFIEHLAPLSLAESWDNIGLMVGNIDRTAKKVMLCLDVTYDACKYAANEAVDLIISHHPLIFSGIKKLNSEYVQFRSIEHLIKNNISVYSAHTNLDSAVKGVNSSLAERIGLICGSDDIGLGRWGRFEGEFTLIQFIEHIKSKLDANTVRIVGKHEGKINRVGVFCGSFDGDFSVFGRHNIDVLVTGDVKYHDAIDAINMGHCLIDAGHFNTERVVIHPLLMQLRLTFPGLEVIRYDMETDPFIYY